MRDAFERRKAGSFSRAHRVPAVPCVPPQGVVPALPGGAGFGAMCGGPELPIAYQELLATCHGLAQLGSELVGDPLDQRLFEATGARVVREAAALCSRLQVGRTVRSVNNVAAAGRMQQCSSGLGVCCNLQQPCQQLTRSPPAAPPAGWRMLDDGGGQAVEVVTVSEDGEFAGGVSPHASPRGGPGSPGVLATAHVRTRCAPRQGGRGGRGGR